MNFATGDKVYNVKTRKVFVVKSDYPLMIRAVTSYFNPKEHGPAFKPNPDNLIKVSNNG